MARVKYNGTTKTRVTWCSMGKVFSYNVKPGEVITVPDSQVANICGGGKFLTLNTAIKTTPTKINKKTIIKEVEPEPVSEPVVKTVVPIVETVEPVVETVAPVVETVESVVEVVDEEEEEEVSEVTREEEGVVYEKIDYTSIRKSDLKAMCIAKGISSKGNRDDLITRLCNFSKGIITEY